MATFAKSLRSEIVKIFIGIMVVMMMMTTRCHGAKEKTRMAAFTVLSTSHWLLSVITRDGPGADYDGDMAMMMTTMMTLSRMTILMMMTMMIMMTMMMMTPMMMMI